jgi:2-dehydro-3-deoxygalactonokinase
MKTFISCDWGTSAFRLRLIDSSAPGAIDGSNTSAIDGSNMSAIDGSSPSVVATFSSNAGIAATHSAWQTSGRPPIEREAFYREVLERGIGELAKAMPARGEQAGSPSLDGCPGLDGIAVIISGMASSSIGMLELPYQELPFDISGADLQPTILPPTPASPRTIYIIPGVRSAIDVMRGEETQLLGCGPATPGDRIFIFPGTHSKHVVVRNGQALDFRTYMTGEIFALLSTQSILAASVTAPAATALPTLPRAAPPDAFFEGLALSREYGFLHNAFITRTNQLFQRYSKEDNYHFLSGLLIGEELQSICNGPDPIALLATSPLRESYSAALEFLNYGAVPAIDADQALIKGHCAIFARFGSTIAPPECK